ncbi:N-6 DNA methylase [Microbispora cellulosiformans]|uniref:site-specific DNA-methyltransferase (adenine-specific) n=1 Tax=Microbispora cellulosiformans TaxID=2614688 RepID=A0A5J5JXD2_9ACTN|nr:N-6 DNA methylase [Microbispora cellulosiformans]KAA9374847.1 N-6 DNA methylase [Microbispora cellulosiformans]
MLNITVAGTTLSTYYLSDPGLFLREERGQIGSEDAETGIRQARRELRRLVADIDETSTAGQTRKHMLNWLGSFGWRFPSTLPGADDPLIARAEAESDDLVWVLITPPAQHLDAAPSGRRGGNLRPQRQAEVCAREGTLPAVLLSNGSELRVIRRDPGLGGEASYLAVDLAGLAELGDDHEWRVLWALLRPEAFLPDGDGASLWDRIERASADAASSVSENLSGGVRKALRAIANGALAHWRRRGEPAPAPRELFADALKIAYRLLFVAYAEDRGLLPVGTPAYDQGYSLRSLRKQIIDPGSVWTPDGGYLWSTLRAQWGMLRDGADAGELQITAFDGGLFDPAKCPLLDDPALIVGDTFVRDVIDALSFTEPIKSVKGKQIVGRRPVNYRELGVEQLGSIYEGLLSFEPQIADGPKALARVGRGQSAVYQVLDADRLPEGAEALEHYDAGTFYLFEATGQRKGSGSYYTARPLAHFVVGEALRPLTENATPEQILNLRVCDPAMGSGAFLVPAVHRLTEAYGEALAREGELLDHKLDDTQRAAYRRLIVERCIYGVDLNPMAVELAKVSLWLAAAAAGKPLSFLDAHLRCGNAVVGASLDAWEGVPTPAQGGRVSKAATKSENELQVSLFDVPAPDLALVTRVRRSLATDPSDDRLQIRAKEQRFSSLLRGADFRRLQELGDWWVAPFFVERLRGNSAQWVNSREDIKGSKKLPPHLQGVTEQIRKEVRPFHWEIEFPEVFFDSEGRRRSDAGFDVMIGNPPWEGITFKAAEFYGRFDPSYSLLKKKAEKEARQEELDGRREVQSARELVDAYLVGMKAFVKSSGEYRMLGTKGTYNLYRAFLERELSLLSPKGRIGVVIDAGVVGDAGTQYHRRELLDRCTVEHFVLCDNVNKIFPIDSREQFLLLVAEKGGATDPLPFTSGVSLFEHLMDLPDRTLNIPRNVIEALAPETLAIPDTRDSMLLDLLRVIYAGHPLFLSLMEAGEWQVEWGRELHIHDNRKLFAVDGAGPLLYEGKHFHQFVHNFAEPSYRLIEPDGIDLLLQRAAKRRKARALYLSLARKKGEECLCGGSLRREILEPPVDHYRPCLRQVASATNERTLISAVIPPGIAVTESVHFFYRSSWNHVKGGYETILGAEAMVYVVALMNSLVLDFIVRRKAGSHVTKSIMASLPVADVPLDRGPGAEIVRLSARLTCRAPEFDELAEVLGVECAPLSKAEERDLRAELDARVAHLYGLSADHLELILADFKQSADSEGSPVRPDEEYKHLVRSHFMRLDG